MELESINNLSPEEYIRLREQSKSDSELIILKTLAERYPDEYKYISDAWRVAYADRKTQMDQLDYIRYNLVRAIALRAKASTFEDITKQNLASVVANMFAIRNNKDLYIRRYPTGFPQLDNVLDGGFAAGMHVLGAASSMGKSTFVLQLIDNVLENNLSLPEEQRIHIILAAEEMTAKEIVAKQISLHTYTDPRTKWRKEHTDWQHLDANYVRQEEEYFLRVARTASELLDFGFQESIKDDEWAVQETAAKHVAQLDKYLTILDVNSVGADAEWDIDTIVKYVVDYATTYNCKPLVVLDYLQIIPVPDIMQNASDKQQTDYKVRTVRKLAAQHDLPVLVVSSVSRAGYDVPFTMAAYKESGSIEYSATTLLGLQLAGVEYTKIYNPIKAKSAYIRKMQLVVLKQRYGQLSEPLWFDFLPKYNNFVEIRRPENDIEALRIIYKAMGLPEDKVDTVVDAALKKEEVKDKSSSSNDVDAKSEQDEQLVLPDAVPSPAPAKKKGGRSRSAMANAIRNGSM